MQILKKPLNGALKKPQKAWFILGVSGLFFFFGDAQESGQSSLRDIQNGKVEGGFIANLKRKDVWCKTLFPRSVGFFLFTKVLPERHVLEAEGW